jgi:ectoine hydroxylase-related dioxygenase (phytanoyl-CoA dioxygenase family)
MDSSTLLGYRADFEAHGYVVIKQLFSVEEASFYRDHYMRLRGQGTYPGDFAGVDLNSEDPLKRYPRMIHMHRWDEISLRWMLDPRLRDAMTALVGRTPYAVQTMLYFKPPKARGQALHQDQYYLRVQPGTCIAAWMALDPCDEANGCMRVVPGSQHWPLLCTEKADTSQSFTDVTVPIPAGQRVDPVIMEPGDVFFFNGQVVHGSFPNVTEDRFRRSLIGHYIDGEAQQVGKFYQPALRMDGTVVELDESQDATQCGIWVDQAGQPVLEMTGMAPPRTPVTE